MKTPHDLLVLRQLVVGHAVETSWPNSTDVKRYHVFTRKGEAVFRPLDVKPFEDERDMDFIAGETGIFAWYEWSRTSTKPDSKRTTGFRPVIVAMSMHDVLLFCASVSEGDLFGMAASSALTDINRKNRTLKESHND